MSDEEITIRLEGSEESLLRAEAAANGMYVNEYVSEIVTKTLNEYAQKAAYGGLPFVPNRPSKGRKNGN